jgi:hypothetical protein
MPEDHPYRKNPSVADLIRRRAADEAAHAAEEAARKAALRVVERWNEERPVLWSPTIRCAVPPYKRQRAPMMAPFPIRKIFLSGLVQNL